MLLKKAGDERLCEIVMSKFVKTANRGSGPEILMAERAVEDECLIVANNGVWDVVPENIACGIVNRTLGDETLGVDCNSNNNNNISSAGFSIIDNDTEADAKFPCKSGVAATILCRLALGRGSSNNVSVMVVDLKSNR